MRWSKTKPSSNPILSNWLLIPKSPPPLGKRQSSLWEEKGQNRRGSCHNDVIPSETDIRWFTFSLAPMLAVICFGFFLVFFFTLRCFSKRREKKKKKKKYAYVKSKQKKVKKGLPFTFFLRKKKGKQFANFYWLFGISPNSKQFQEIFVFPLSFTPVNKQSFHQLKLRIEVSEFLRFSYTLLSK